MIRRLFFFSPNWMRRSRPRFMLSAAKGWGNRTNPHRKVGGF